MNDNSSGGANSDRDRADQSSADRATDSTAAVNGSVAANGEAIRIQGARVHNLQNVDLDIPRNRFVVLTGVSGSGKSSLAIDTLFAEGQRQYIESLSVDARHFLDQMQRPDVDLIEGLQPTLCIDQRGWIANPRSTVATITEIYDYLRLLYARAGDVHCHRCGAAIVQQSTEEICEALVSLPAGTKLMLLAPLVRGRQGKHEEVFRAIRKAHLVRVRIDGLVCDLEQLPELNARKKHSIEAVVDRIVIKPDISRRLAESVDTAVKLGEGTAIACYLDAALADEENRDGRWRDEVFSTQFACRDCGVSIEEIQPRTFSFNSPYGACQLCQGLGVIEQFDRDLVLPDSEKSLAEGAVAPWKGLPAGEFKKRQAELAPLLAVAKVDAETPLTHWPAASMKKFLQGDGKQQQGLMLLLEKEYATATKKARREQLELFRGKVTCGACDGSRLRPEAQGVRVAGKNLHEMTRMTLAEAGEFFAEIAAQSPDDAVATPILQDIATRLSFLLKVGVGYLTLARAADTLSGGEMQRVRLAASVGSGLVGVCYVLDEPSIGLHPRDNHRLIEALRDLQQQGNTVLVVEHDEAVMREADRLIDVGPGAGDRGGAIVAQGTPAQVAAERQSLTGRFLSGEEHIPVPEKRRRTAKSRSITMEGVAANNLKQVDVRFPLGALVCVTGVSGSGKSSLVNETLAPALLRRLGHPAPKPGQHASLRGASQVDKVVRIDQAPIGRTPRSNAATYTGAFDEIRKVFASTRAAKQRGFRVGRFSFNTKGGRCEECQGQGLKKIEMSFLPDLFVTCPACGGKRFNRQTLAVRYRGRSIADVLDLPVEEAVEFFANFSHIHRPLECLEAVGLGYLPLGQPASTLSGGEAQRIKLATELARTDTGNTLYLLDEPTTGLHLADIRRLLDVLIRLVDKGNTVIVIEHHLDIIKTADWVIDLGPEGGEAGGRIVAAGTPEDVAACAASQTGRFLREALP